LPDLLLLVADRSRYFCNLRSLRMIKYMNE
jgi:hypothetical protein